MPIEWSLRMSHTTVLIVIFFIICLFTFPACIKNNLPSLTFSLTIVQALLLTFLEQLLYEQGEGFYSEFLVLLTSAIGALLSIRLYNLQRLTMDGASILLASMYKHMPPLSCITLISNSCFLFSLCCQDFCNVFWHSAHGIYINTCCYHLFHIYVFCNTKQLLYT